MKASKFGEQLPAHEDCILPEAALKPSLPEISRVDLNTGDHWHSLCISGVRSGDRCLPSS